MSDRLPNPYEELLDENIALKDELAALRLDRARLDVLEKAWAKANQREKQLGMWWVTAYCGKRGTLREAADAAMQQEGKAE